MPGMFRSDKRQGNHMPALRFPGSGRQHFHQYAQEGGLHEAPGNVEQGDECRRFGKLIGSGLPDFQFQLHRAQDLPLLQGL